MMTYLFPRPQEDFPQAGGLPYVRIPLSVLVSFLGSYLVPLFPAFRSPLRPLIGQFSSYEHAFGFLRGFSRFFEGTSDSLLSSLSVVLEQSPLPSSESEVT